MIVVFGSINVDLVASVDRLPQPGETLLGRSCSIHPGGKGANQALAARRAGADVGLYGAVGCDAFAEPALALLRADDVDVENVRTVDSSTGVALIHVDGSGENTITVISGANADARADQIPDGALQASTVIVMQLETPLVEVEALAQRARTSGARVILNAAPARPVSTALLDHVDVLIVNEGEAERVAAALGFPSEPGAFVAEYRQRLRGEVIVSLGGNGLVASSNGGSIRLAAPDVHVVDTVGAGDALVGACAAALDRNTPWSRALQEAIAAGSLACTRAGAQPSLPHHAAIRALADTI